MAFPNRLQAGAGKRQLRQIRRTAKAIRKRLSRQLFKLPPNVLKELAGGWIFFHIGMREESGFISEYQGPKGLGVRANLPRD